MWMRDAFEAKQHDAETFSMGPFRAVVTRGADGRSAGWVTLDDAQVNSAEATRSLANLRAAFTSQKIDIEVEFNTDAFPHAAEWFQAAGLTLAEQHPLMACRPETFVPVESTQVSLTRLSHNTKLAELEAFQAIRWSNGGDLHRKGPPIEQLRIELKALTSVYILGWLDWEPVGTGVSHATKDAAEIVGVVTRNDKRRRGVAAAVTSELVRRHFGRGGDYVFLEAEHEQAARIYGRLGFVKFGSKVVYK